MLAKPPAIGPDRDSPRHSSRIQVVDVASGALWPVVHADWLVLASDQAPWQDSLLVEQHRKPLFEEPANVSRAHHIGIRLSPPSLSRLFKQSTGLSPHQYLLWQRMERAKHLLADSRRKIAAVSDAPGLSAPEPFSHHLPHAAGEDARRIPEAAQRAIERVARFRKYRTNS
jgi:AraC-like DNA-binding protein